MGLLLSTVARSGDIPWYYLRSLGFFEFRRCRFPARKMSTLQLCQDSSSPVVKSGPKQENQDNTFVRDTVIQSMHEQNHRYTEKIAEHGHDVASDNLDYCDSSGFHYADENTAASPDHKGTNHHAGQSMFSLTPVKEEEEADEYQNCQCLDTELDDTFPVFEDAKTFSQNSLSEQEETVSRRVCSLRRLRPYGSVSSDSGVDGVHGSSSNSSTCSSCRVSSDSSRCSANSTSSVCPSSADLDSNSSTRSVRRSSSDFDSNSRASSDSESSSSSNNACHSSPDCDSESCSSSHNACHSFPDCDSNTGTSIVCQSSSNCGSHSQRHGIRRLSSNREPKSRPPYQFESYVNIQSSSDCESNSMPSSDCESNSSLHCGELSSTMPSDESEVQGEGSCDALAQSQSSSDESSGLEFHRKVEDNDYMRTEELDLAPFQRKLSKSPKEQATPLGRPKRPELKPLNFRARRKVTFSEGQAEQGHGEQGQESGSSEGDPVVSSSPSVPSFSSVSPPCPTTLSPPSPTVPFVKGFRPVFSRQDSEESYSSSSSSSSGGSILAVPLSPLSPTSPDHCPAFVFPDMQPNHNCFTEPSAGSDLVLVAEGERFHVHRAVVAWQCCALRDHLIQSGATEVLLMDRRAADLLTLLHLLYPFKPQCITESNVGVLVELGHCLGCERVLRMCSSFLCGLAHLPHLCTHLVPSSPPPHRHHHPPPPHPAPWSTPMRGDGIEGGRSPAHASPTRPDQGNMAATRWCACAVTKVERALDFLMLASTYDLDDVYHAFLDVTAKVKAVELTSSPRFHHLSAVIREDVLLSRLTSLENRVNDLDLQRSDLVTCDLARHHGYRHTFSGPLCLKCSSKRLLRQAKDSTAL